MVDNAPASEDDTTSEESLTRIMSFTRTMGDELSSPIGDSDVPASEESVGINRRSGNMSEESFTELKEKVPENVK